MAKTFKGVKKMEIADLSPDGTVGTVWVEVGATAQSTVNLTTSAPTFTDILVEEQTTAFDSIKTDGTQQLVWSTYSTDPDKLVILIGGTKTLGAAAVAGVAATHGAITGGTGYTNGSYTNISLLSAGVDKGVKANMTVAGGIVTVATFTNGGAANVVGDALTISGTPLGAGTGFTMLVATISATAAVGDRWSAPTSSVQLTKSVRITTSNGIMITIVKTLFTGLLNYNLTTAKIGQIDITAKILSPDNTVLSPYWFDYV